MKNFLAIDYGTKRIGLAYNVLSLVEPLSVIENQVNDDNPIASEQSLLAIGQICLERKIEQIVLGLSEAEMAVKIKIFSKLLHEKIGLPVILMDETLSSHEVGRRMKEAGFPLKKRQGPIDHFAAALILEDFLETEVV
jgi:putative transcription antitermination factor YqgF